MNESPVPRQPREMSRIRKSTRKVTQKITGKRTRAAKGPRAVRHARRGTPARTSSKVAPASRHPLRVKTSEISLRSLFDHAWDAILVVDRNRYIVDANPSACQLFGSSRDRLLRMKIDSLRRDFSKRRYAQLLDGKLRPPLVRGEHALRTKDSGEKTLDAIGVRIDRSHAIFIVRDITELRRVEEKIKASEEKFRSIIRDAGLGIVYVDVAGVHVDVNDAFCEMTGYCREELVGHGIPYPYWPKDQTLRFARGMRNALEGRVTVAETAFIKKNGQRVPVRVHPSFVKDHTGVTVGEIGIFEDISSWETLQQELIYSQKMQTVGALAGGIVHEFNNLHCGMRLVIETALAEIRHPLPIKQDLEAVLERLERASSITGQLRAFAQKAPSRKASTSLPGVVEEALGMAAATLRKDRVSVELQLANNVPELVLDRVQMVQAVLNLILNARDAMESVEARRLTVQTGVEDGRAFVRLHDTGSGIAAEHLGSIFDPFFTTKEDRGEQVRSGFGLGLTVTETIVRDHGGAIDVSSAVGKGAAFTVWLPLDAPTMVPRTRPTPEFYARVRGKRVLIAENESVLRMLLGNAMRSVGCVVDAAGSGEQSLDLLVRGRHDVVVIGTGLQAGGAEKLLCAVGRKKTAARPATIAVLGEADTTGRKKAVSPRADAVLRAPVTLDSLYAALDAAVAAREKRRGRMPTRTGGTIPKESRD